MLFRSDLEPDNVRAFKKWLGQLPDMKSTSVPRCIAPTTYKTARSTDLHVFCDASDKALAAVSYVRYECQDTIHCAYVMGKAKVAPLKSQTIPRLELMAAVLGVELYSILARELTTTFDNVCFWSDSMTALSYIQNHDIRLPVFECNRVRAII